MVEIMLMCTHTLSHTHTHTTAESCTDGNRQDRYVNQRDRHKQCPQEETCSLCRGPQSVNFVWFTDRLIINFMLHTCPALMQESLHATALCHR